jgi:uncharacterized protein (TIGR00375 family)
MRVIMDAHIHSHFSRATSSQMNINDLALWAKYKGIDILGTGDFTHPFWFNELKNKFQEDGSGLLKLKDKEEYSLSFLLSTEISCIYSEGGKGRRIHLVIFAPSFGDVTKINHALEKIGNLYADGRPVFGLSAHQATKIILEASPESIVIPAHIWTPWFSLFGSASGFDSITECFKDLTPNIFALETGLSSDPPMNWRVSALDQYALVSFSDSHSPGNLGREAVVFEVKNKQALTFAKIKQMLREANPIFRQKLNQPKEDFLAYTLEFFPEEGKYHFDGHRACGVVLSPDEAKKLNNLCPKCHRPLTIGVMHRVMELSDRPEGFLPEKAVPFYSLIPLKEIIAQALNQDSKAKQVEKEYQLIVQSICPELPLLLDYPLEEVENKVNPKIAQYLKIMRQGKVIKMPGYDGVYGTIKVKEDKDESTGFKQNSLF